MSENADIVDRLRAMSFIVCGEAADEIERLRTENKRLADTLWARDWGHG